MNASNKNKNQKAKVIPIKHKWYDSPFYKMLLHVVSTSVIALAIGLAAYGLDHFADWMKHTGGSDFLVSGFHLFADTVFVLDVLWALGNIIRGFIREWREK
jgi:hypothetical protein